MNLIGLHRRVTNEYNLKRQTENRAQMNLTRLQFCSCKTRSQTEVVKPVTLQFYLTEGPESPKSNLPCSALACAALNLD